MEIVEQCNEESLRLVTKTYDYWVETDIGKYLDLMCGNTAYIWGYSNQQLLSALKSQFDNVQFLRGKSSEQNLLVNQVSSALIKQSGMSGILYAISGSDGVEAGLEIADQYWQIKNKNKNKIVSFAPGYHGATYLARQLRGQKSSDRNIVLPAPTDNQEIDECKTLELLKNLIKSDRTIGTVIMESIPWVNGIRPWSDHWWKEIRSITEEEQILLVVDDVWGGFGKVGPMFSYQKYNILPDIAIMGKSITGGYIPLSCALVSPNVSSVVKDTVLYGHTWQPQMLGIALVSEVLNMFDYSLVNSIHERQITLIDKLKSAGVHGYRGSGLTKELLVNRELTKSDFEQAGLCNTQYTKNSIFLVTPLIADDQYWVELEQRLVKLLTC